MTSRRLALTAVVLLLAASCSVPTSTRPVGVEIDARSLSLDPALLDTPTLPAWLVDAEMPLRLDAVLELRGDHADFGGLSGMVLEPATTGADHATCLDGARLLVVTDRGRWLEARLRAPDGPLVGFESARLGALRETDGRPVGGRMRHDAEEITAWGGGLVVAYEGDHRLMLHTDAAPPLDDPRPRQLPVPEAVAVLAENDGLEALTGLGDGLLLALAEKSTRDGEVAALRGWVGDPRSAEGWRALRIAATGPLEATGVALLPWRDVLLLERYFDPIDERVHVRLSTLAVDALIAASPDELVPTREVLRFPDALPVDNFEAVAVLPVDGGVTVLVLADDNFSPAQRTLLLQLFLPTPA
ncbi:MAG: esterase-like activity of phytase family protein [Acidobacteriota bacterium]